MTLGLKAKKPSLSSIFINLLFVSTSWFVAAGCGDDTGIRLNAVPGDSFPAGEVAEFSFELNREIANPYDSEEIKINFHVWQENKDTMNVPAFFYVPYTADSVDLFQNGEPLWKVRFTPKTAGIFKYFISVEHNGDKIQTGIRSFEALENNYSGFIHATRGDRLFRYSSGEIFFPSGLNLAHPPHTGGPLDYDYFFRTMKENDMNFMRIWLTPQWGKHAVALEWTDNQYPSQKGKLGLKKINSEMAYRLDSIMNSAGKHGIYVMLCLLDERELEEGSHWKENPYNAASGGVIDNPMDFFSDIKARKAFQNRLRYLIARYSAYPNLFAWEFWNEFDHHRLIPDWEAQRKTVGSWHQEMSRYLKQNDPHGHMVSTSVVGSRTDSLIWDYKEIDFVQAHSYVGKDHLADRSYDLFALFKEAYPKKPFFIGEMGTDWRGYNKENNAEAIGLHNGLWESSLGGHSATGMWWWWNEIDQAGLWNEWKEIAAFTKGMDRNKSKYHLVNEDNDSKIAGRYVVSGDSIWVWFYNREYNWKDIKEGNSISQINSIHVSLSHIPPGSYHLLHFDNGEFSNENNLIKSDGTVKINLNEFKDEYAVLLVKEL